LEQNEWDVQVTEMVTIKKIAELCGFSRGTVDRVLNDRGNVKPETEQVIRKMAEQLGYQPNPAGKALAARKHKPVVGVLLASVGNPFFEDVIAGIKSAEDSYKIYGMQVLWQSMKGYDVERQCAILDEMKNQINALIFTPINDVRVVKKIDEFIAAGIFVVTLNNDIEGSRRNCYIGSDYENGGETACALLRLLIGEQAKIGVMMGSSKVLGHNQRMAGFEKIMKTLPGYTIVAKEENEDDDICSYEKTQQMLHEHVEINAIYIVAAGVYGACRAVLNMHLQSKVHVVAFDSVPSTVEMMERGVVKAIIYQHPYRQGKKAMQVVFEYLVNGIAPKNSQYFMQNEIKILENL
jgi:LacI family transcriptional regulator